MSEYLRPITGTSVGNLIEGEMFGLNKGLSGLYVEGGDIFHICLLPGRFKFVRSGFNMGGPLYEVQPLVEPGVQFYIKNVGVNIMSDPYPGVYSNVV